MCGIPETNGRYICDGKRVYREGLGLYLSRLYPTDKSRYGGNNVRLYRVNISEIVTHKKNLGWTIGVQIKWTNHRKS